MSRSRKKTPIHGWTTAASEKEDKRLARKRWRAALRRVKDDDTPLPLLREVSSVWLMDKDGKYWWGQKSPDKDMRK